MTKLEQIARKHLEEAIHRTDFGWEEVSSDAILAALLELREELAKEWDDNGLGARSFRDSADFAAAKLAEEKMDG